MAKKRKTQVLRVRNVMKSCQDFHDRQANVFFADPSLISEKLESYSFLGFIQRLENKVSLT